MGIFSKSIACIHIWSTDCRLQPPFFLHFVPIIFPLFHLSFLLLCIFQSNLSPNTPKFTPNLTVFLQQDSLLTYVLGLLYSNSFLSLFPAKKTAAKKSKAEKAELATHVVPPHTYSVPWPRSYLYTYSLLFLNFINSHFPLHSHTALNSNPTPYFLKNSL